MVTPQSLLLHSPLGILGTLAHAPGVSFKPPGPGREPRSTTWESSNIAITQTAGSLFFLFLGRFLLLGACARQKEAERQKARNHPPGGDGHAAIPSPPFSSRDLGHALTCTRREFKPPGPGCEPRSTTWESSDIAITLTAGPRAACTQ